MVIEIGQEYRSDYSKTKYNIIYIGKHQVVLERAIDGRIFCKDFERFKKNYSLVIKEPIEGELWITEDGYQKYIIENTPRKNIVFCTLDKRSYSVKPLKEFMEIYKYIE